MTNYDSTEIPAAYDRARDHGPEVINLWMRTIAAHVDDRSITRILDLGCGTGRFSEALAENARRAIADVEESRPLVHEIEIEIAGQSLARE